MSSRTAQGRASSSRRPRRPRPKRGSYLVDQHRWKLSLLRDFIRRHGWEKLKPGTVVAPGVFLHRYVTHRRSCYRADKIEAWLVAECEAVPGWSWSVFEDAHHRNLDNLLSIVRKHGWEVLATKPIVDGARLDKWVYHRRDEYKRGELDTWLVRGLEALPGWTWAPRRTGYERNLRLLGEHIARHGWSSIDAHTVTASGDHLGNWVCIMRARYRRDDLEPWVVSELEKIPGWTWEPNQATQQGNLQTLAAFVALNGWDEVKRELVIGDFKAGLWVSNVRSRYRRGELAEETRVGLDAIRGWSWTGRPGPKKGRDR